MILDKKQWQLIHDIEKYDFEVVYLKKIFFNKEFYKQFYLNLSEHSFYNSLCETYSNGPVFVVFVSGINAIKEVRKVIGPTNPSDAEEWQIRKIYGINTCLNAVHASDSYQSYVNETKLINNYDQKEA